MGTDAVSDPKVTRWRPGAVVLLVAGVLVALYLTLAIAFVASGEFLGVLCSSDCPRPTPARWLATVLLTSIPGAVLGAAVAWWRHSPRWLALALVPPVTVGALYLWIAIT